jgi:hypothetical protein
MKQIGIIFFIIISFLASFEAWALQQFMHLPDAKVEEIMLKKVEGATREGKALKLQTDAGTVTFEDRINIGERSAKYYLVSIRDTLGYFYLIRVFGYESRGYILVDKKTGQTIDLYGMPIFSPDGKKFVSVSLDLEAGYIPNLIRIYELVDDKFAKEWEYVYQGMKGPANPVWLDNSAIVFFEVTYEKVPTEANLKKKPFIIEWVNDRWNKPRPLK